MIIILIIIAIIVLYFYFKRKSSKKNVKNLPQCNIRFSHITDEEAEARNVKFKEQLDAHTELTVLYKKLYDTFIPKSDGRYKGNIAGLLSDTTRARRLEEAHKIVSSIYSDDKQAYLNFFETCYDILLSSMVHSQNEKLISCVKFTLDDAEFGNSIINKSGFWDTLNDINDSPEDNEATMKINTPEIAAKVVIKKKNGNLTYEIKKLYESAKHGYCMTDPLIYSAEILIAICARYEFNSLLFKKDVEKYDLPNKRWM